MNRSGRFVVQRRRADAESLHEFVPPIVAEATVVVAEVTDRALVLGSRQAASLVDPQRVEQAGLRVVRRRSGGGIVLLRPDAQVWVDFWIPAGDRWWSDDVVAAALLVGDLWAEVLTSLGVPCLNVHRSGLQETPWSDLVCFAGLGPGEVSDDGGVKWVGVSQRRTREWIRLQTMVHRHWSAEEALMALDLSSAQRTAGVQALATQVGSIGDAEVVPALLDHLAN
jgi:lipoate-protein ligase A